ncbi:MAG: Fe(3+) dicitrate transport protein [Kiritimatiellia bacterium]
MNTLDISLKSSLLILITSINFTPALADSHNTVQLEKVQVTGDMFDQATQNDVFLHAGSRQLVSQEDIEKAGDLTIRDALNRVPGVFTPELKGTGSLNSTLNVSIHGLPARLTPSTNILLDGIPVSNAPYGQPELSLSPLNLGYLDHIDIMKNGGSVRYGPNNVGGTINFVTRKIPEDFAANIGLQTQGWQDGNNQQAFNNGTANLFTGGTTDQGLGLALMYSGTRGENYRENSDENIDDILLKYNYDLSEKLELSGRLHHYQAASKIPGGLSIAEFKDNPYQSNRPYDEFNGDRKEAVVNLKYTPNNYQEFELSSYYTQSFREFTLANGSADTLTKLDVLPRDYAVFAFEPRFSQFYSAGSSLNEITLGYRYTNEASEEKRQRRKITDTNRNDPFSADPLLHRNTKSTTDAHAIYLDNKVEIGNWVITPGVRIEHIEISRTNHKEGADFKHKNKVEYDEVLPSFNLLYLISDQLNTFFTFNSAFSPVHFLDISDKLDFDNLKAERSKNYDLGLRYQQHQGLGAEASLFLIDFDNVIEYNGIAKHHENAGKQKFTGVELATNYDFSSLNLALTGITSFITYTYTEATQVSGENKGNEVPFTSAHQYSLGLGYEQAQWDMRITMLGRSNQYSDSANSKTESENLAKTDYAGRLPAYTTTNVNLNYQLNSQARLGLGIKNVFDENYFTASSNTNSGKYSGAPRSLYLKANYEF